jgi:biopolymer transport protein ExbB
LSNELQDQAHGLLIDTMLQQDSSTQKVESESTSKGLVGGQA